MQRVLTIVAVLALGAPAAATPQSRSREASRDQQRTVEQSREQQRTTEQRREQQRTTEQRREQRRRDSRAEETERTTRTLNIGADGEITVSNIAGDMVVTRGSGNSVTMEIIKTARAETSEDAKMLLGLVTVDVMERGPRAEIKTRYPSEEDLQRRNRRNINVDVAFNLTVPAQARVSLHSISGSLSVRDVAGVLMLDSISGNIKLANTGRTATAKTISGNVEMADTTADGALTGGTISGTVSLRKITARSLNLSSVSGEVVLEDVNSERIDAQSVSGDVRFAGDFAPNGRYEFTSHSGSVKLAVGSGTGFQIEATTFSGGIQSDLPLTLDGGRRSRNSLRGRYGNGSAILDLTSFSGSIVITKR
jgi:putative adhesin